VEVAWLADSVDLLVEWQSFIEYESEALGSLMGLVTLIFWPWNWYASRIKGWEPSLQIWAR